MRFSTKVTISLLAIISITGMSLSFIVYRANIDTLEKRIIDRIGEQASNTMEMIDRNLYERYSDIRIIASDPIIRSRDATPRQITKRLIEFRNTYKMYVSLSFFDLNRVRIADTSGADVGEQHPLVNYWKNPDIDKNFTMNVSESMSFGEIVIHFS